MNERAIFWDMHLKPGTIRYGFEIVKWNRQVINRQNQPMSEYLVKCLTCNTESFNTINMLTAKCKVCKAKEKLPKITKSKTHKPHFIVKQKHLKDGLIRNNKQILHWEKQLVIRNRCYSQYRVKCLLCDFESSIISGQLKNKCINCRYNILPQPIPLNPVVTECKRCSMNDNPEIFKNRLVDRLQDSDPISAAILSESNVMLNSFFLSIDLNDNHSAFYDYLINQQEKILSICKDLTGFDYKLHVLSSSDKTVMDRFE